MDELFKINFMITTPCKQYITAHNCCQLLYTVYFKSNYEKHASRVSQVIAAVAKVSCKHGLWLVAHVNKKIPHNHMTDCVAFFLYLISYILWYLRMVPCFALLLTFANSYTHPSIISFALSTSLPLIARPDATFAPFAVWAMCFSVFPSPLPSCVQNG